MGGGQAHVIVLPEVDLVYYILRQHYQSNNEISCFPLGCFPTTVFRFQVDIIYGIYSTIIYIMSVDNKLGI